MKLSNDSRTALISVLVNIVFIAIFAAGWSAWEHLFKEDYMRNKTKKADEAKAAARFRRPEPTEEQKAEFKRRREQFMQMRKNELELRNGLVTVLKKNNASAAKIAQAECDLTLSKMKMMRRKRSGGVSGAELVVKAFYAAKAAPAKVDMNCEASIRSAIADIEFKQQSVFLRRFMADEDFKTAAEAWRKEQSDANLKALCEAEQNVPEMRPRQRSGK